MRGAVMYRNSMQPYMFAHLRAGGTGTRLAYHFWLHPFVMLFLAMVIFVAGFLLLVWRNLYFARHDRANLVMFLRETLNAREI